MTKRTLLATISASIAISLPSVFGCLWATAASADTITSGTYTGIDGPPTTDGGPALSGSGGDGISDGGDNSVSGGTFTGGTGGDSSGGGGSTPNIGGSGGDGLAVYGTGTTVEITGGTFVGGAGGNASGGEQNNGGSGGSGLLVYGSDVAATVSGGSFTGGAAGTPGGASGYSFHSYVSGVITLVGTFQDAPSSPITDSTGTITGQLADNDSIETYSYDTDSGGTIILAAPAVPEPASLGLMAVGTVGLLRRRRRA